MSFCCSWLPFGCSWAHFWSSWGLLGSSWLPLGRLLGTSWGSLGAILAASGRSWGALGTCIYVGAFWVPFLHPTWPHLGGQHGTKMAPKWSPTLSKRGFETLLSRKTCIFKNIYKTPVKSTEMSPRGDPERAKIAPRQPFWPPKTTRNKWFRHRNGCFTCRRVHFRCPKRPFRLWT